MLLVAAEAHDNHLALRALVALHGIDADVQQAGQVQFYRELGEAGADAGGGNVPVAITSIGRVGEVVTANGALTLGVNGVQLPASALIRVSQAG